MAVPILHIDVVSDVVCPWCLIGFKRLEQALSRFDDRLEAEDRFQAEIVWQPFELNPGMPAGGQAIGEHMAQKYGATFEQAADMRARLERSGAEVGVDLHFDDDMRIYGTFDAHRLLWWAGEPRDEDPAARAGERFADHSRESAGDRRRAKPGRRARGRQTELALALFATYFVEKRAIDDRDVLVEAAVGAGFDGHEARDVLERDDYAEPVRKAETRWVKGGIRSVPTVVLAGRRAIVGAQEVRVFEQQLEQVAGALEGRLAETPGFEPGNEPLTR